MQDQLATAKALRECAPLMVDYDKCMQAELPRAKPRQLYRVPEAYRDNRI